MKVDVVMPQMGESLSEGTVAKWLKKPGDRIQRDEILLEISTDKVDSEIPAPTSGLLAEILVPEGQTVKVGTPIARIETEVRERAAEEKQPAIATGVTASMPEISARPTVEAGRLEEYRPGPEVVEAIPAREGRGRFYSPFVRRVAQEEGINLAELEKVPGSGAGGRVTKQDILAYVDQRKRGVPGVMAPPPPVEAPPPLEVPAAEAPRRYPPERVEIIPMDHIRKLIAEHMVRSVHTSPHVTSITEVDMNRIEMFREKVGQQFEQREGFKLTYMPFIMDAAIRALNEFPLVNSSLEGDKIIVKKYYNIGVAVALDHGLIVPVVKNADEKNLVGLARAVYDLSTRARHKKLKPEEVQDGTFSITNFGVFGTLIGTPIINQPQVAILGVGVVKKRAVVINDAIAIRPMMYLSLSYDHRLIDGAMAGMFLQRVAKSLEEFDLDIAL